MRKPPAASVPTSTRRSRRPRRDNPTYKVIVKTSTAKSKESFKGLTYDYMKKYIAAHDDEEKTIMAEFEMLRGHLC